MLVKYVDTWTWEGLILSAILTTNCELALKKHPNPRSAKGPKDVTMAWDFPSQVTVPGPKICGNFKAPLKKYGFIPANVWWRSSTLIQPFVPREPCRSCEF